VACDAVLKGIVRLAHETSGRGDVVARYSEDELVILLQDADGQAARTRASALQEAVAAREFTSGTDRIKCAISVAVAERTTRWATAHDLLLAADRALYAVKTARVS
jgi:diguanylate cyclase (GGDEF)-like protein